MLAILPLLCLSFTGLRAQYDVTTQGIMSITVAGLDPQYDPYALNIKYDDEANSATTPGGYECGSYIAHKGPEQTLSMLGVLDQWPPDSSKQYWDALNYEVAGNNAELQLGLDTMRLYVQEHPFAMTQYGETLDAIRQTGAFISYMSNNRADSSLVWKIQYNWLIDALQWNQDSNYQIVIWAAMANTVTWDFNMQCNLFYNYMIRFHDTGSGPNTPWAQIKALRRNQISMRPPQDTTPFYLLPIPPPKVPISFAGVTTHNMSVSSSLSLSPNPASAMLTVDFTLAQGGQTLILIYDETGNTVKSVINSPRPAGINEVIVPLTDLPGGHYFVRMSSGRDVVTKELIVQH